MRGHNISGDLKVDVRSDRSFWIITRSFVDGSIQFPSPIDGKTVSKEVRGLRVRRSLTGREYVVSRIKLTDASGVRRTHNIEADL